MKFIIMLAAALLLVSGLAAADPARVLVLHAQSEAPYATTWAAALRQLSAAGYVSGRTVVFEEHDLSNVEGAGVSILRHRLGSDASYRVILVNGSIAAAALVKYRAASQSRQLPQTVFVNVSDPVGIGLVASLDAPSRTHTAGIAYNFAAREKIRIARRILPALRTIGILYTEMPQSQSWVRLVQEISREKEFQGIDFFYRKVPFVAGDMGSVRMGEVSRKVVREMDGAVDVFIAPNDQFGISEEFARIVSGTSTHPLIGMSPRQTSAAAWVIQDDERTGMLLARMLGSVLSGVDAGGIMPLRSPYRVQYNPSRLRDFGLSVPGVR